MRNSNPDNFTVHVRVVAEIGAEIDDVGRLLEGSNPIRSNYPSEDERMRDFERRRRNHEPHERGVRGDGNDGNIPIGR